MWYKVERNRNHFVIQWFYLWYRICNQIYFKLKVLNIHTRTINASKQDVVNLLETLSSENDMVWPNENWPAMKFKGGIMVGAKGGAWTDKIFRRKI